MPIKKSAWKALRQTIKRTAMNRAVKAGIKKLENKLKKEITAKAKNEAAATFHALAQAWDKAAKKNIIAPNAAARYKSHLQKAVNKIL